MKRIGLIAGQGEFPRTFSREAKGNGYEVVGIGIKRYTEPGLAEEIDNFHWIKLGELSGLIKIFKKEEIKEAVMAGRIPQRVVLSDLALDPLAWQLFRRLKDKQPKAILSAIVEELEKAGIKLLDSVIFLSALLPAKGVLTRRQPSAEDREDIDFGFRLAIELARLDIGQTVVVKDKAVLAIEAMEGTDEAIRRAANFSKKGLVVVKVARPNQDMRFDIPVVGPKTIAVMKEAGGTTLAIEAGKTLLLDKAELIRQANVASISLVAV